MSTEPLSSRRVVVEMTPRPEPIGQWIEPSSLADATKMRADVTSEIMAMQNKLTTNDPAVSGMTQLEYEQWRRRTKFAIAHATRRLILLKGWIKERTIAVANDSDKIAQRNRLYAAWRLLLRCAEHVPDDLAGEIAATVPESFALPEDER